MTQNGELSRQWERGTTRQARHATHVLTVDGRSLPKREIRGVTYIHDCNQYLGFYRRELVRINPENWPLPGLPRKLHKDQ
jgi:hypothetical protein